MEQARPFSSGAYWEARYRAGGDSGAGSAGALARFKAGVINGVVAANRIGSVIDLGCGDGGQLALLELPADYVGVDVSPLALRRCAERFPDRRFVPAALADALPPAELTLSLDVIYHLTEDAVFTGFVRQLFALATRFVVIYSSNVEAEWPSPHVRHRAFSLHVARTQPDWRLLAHLPNPYPFDPARPDDTSFADFFVYGRRGDGCGLGVPGA